MARRERRGLGRSRPARTGGVTGAPLGDAATDGDSATGGDAATGGDSATGPVAPGDGSSPGRRGLSRRGLFAAAAGAAGAAAVGTGGFAAGRASAGGGSSPAVFFGEHQAGIVTPAQDRLHFAAFDVSSSASRENLIELLQDWTDAAARLVRGLDVT